MKKQTKTPAKCHEGQVTLGSGRAGGSHAGPKPGKPGFKPPKEKTQAAVAEFGEGHAKAVAEHALEAVEESRAGPPTARS
jgi:hypothetical protein